MSYEFANFIVKVVLEVTPLFWGDKVGRTYRKGSGGCAGSVKRIQNKLRNPFSSQ
jgi:hypothetical protein